LPVSSSSRWSASSLAGLDACRPPPISPPSSTPQWWPLGGGESVTSGRGYGINRGASPDASPADVPRPSTCRAAAPMPVTRSAVKTLDAGAVASGTSIKLGEPGEPSRWARPPGVVWPRPPLQRVTRPALARAAPSGPRADRVRGAIIAHYFREPGQAQPTIPPFRAARGRQNVANQRLSLVFLTTLPRGAIPDSLPRVRQIEKQPRHRLRRLDRDPEWFDAM
jgi:hypothetical protein